MDENNLHTDSLVKQTNPNPSEKELDLVDHRLQELVPAGLGNSVGKDTVGVGQPTAQAINQGNSLPAIALPIGATQGVKTADLYDPKAAKDLAESKHRNETGGAKT